MTHHLTNCKSAPPPTTLLAKGEAEAWDKFTVFATALFSVLMTIHKDRIRAMEQIMKGAAAIFWRLAKREERP